MKASLLLALLFAGCTTTEYRVQSAYEDCKQAGGTHDKCAAVAAGKQQELEGWRTAPPSDAGEQKARVAPSRVETAPDGTKWYSRVCYCPIAECEVAIHKDCPGAFEVDGEDPSHPLGEYSTIRQQVGYELKYRCLPAPAR